MSKTTISIDEEHFVALLATKRQMQKADRTLSWDDVLAVLHTFYLRDECKMTQEEIKADPDLKYYVDNHPMLIYTKWFYFSFLSNLFYIDKHN